MDICKIDQMNRKEIDDFIICQWFSLQMVLHGKSIDLGVADGWYAVQDNEIVGLTTGWRFFLATVFANSMESEPHY